MKKKSFQLFKTNNPRFQLGQLVRAAGIKRVFSNGDSTNCSYEFYTITEVIHDTMPSYRNNLRDTMKIYLDHQI